MCVGGGGREVLVCVCVCVCVCACLSCRCVLFAFFFVCFALIDPKNKREDLAVGDRVVLTLSTPEISEHLLGSSKHTTIHLGKGVFERIVVDSLLDDEADAAMDTTPSTATTTTGGDDTRMGADSARGGDEMVSLHSLFADAVGAADGAGNATQQQQGK